MKRKRHVIFSNRVRELGPAQRNRDFRRAFISRVPHDGIKRAKEYVMDWDRIEGNWKQFSGKVKEKWGQLTDDELTKINGKRDQLEGLLQQRYGYAKDKARDEIDHWSKGL